MNRFCGGPMRPRLAMTLSNSSNAVVVDPDEELSPSRSWPCPSRRRQLARHVLVEAEVLLGGLHGEASVELLAKTKLELARVVPCGEWLGDRLIVGAHVSDDALDHRTQATERSLGRDRKSVV